MSGCKSHGGSQGARGGRRVGHLRAEPSRKGDRMGSRTGMACPSREGCLAYSRRYQGGRGREEGAGRKGELEFSDVLGRH